LPCGASCTPCARRRLHPGDVVGQRLLAHDGQRRGQLGAASSRAAPPRPAAAPAVPGSPSARAEPAGAGGVGVDVGVHGVIISSATTCIPVPPSSRGAGAAFKGDCS
jgi:hypothetical protein